MAAQVFRTDELYELNFDLSTSVVFYDDTFNLVSVIMEQSLSPTSVNNSIVAYNLGWSGAPKNEIEQF